MIDNDDRREINEALADALNGSPTPDANSLQRFMTAVSTADQQGRSWPDDLRDEVLRQWVFNRQKQIAKEHSRVLIDYRGKKVSKATRVGRRITKDDGTTAFQQSLFTAMTWDEIYVWEKMIADQIDGLQANVAMVAKLRKLHNQFPQSDGPGQAAAALGMTVDEWLAS